MRNSRETDGSVCPGEVWLGGAGRGARVGVPVETAGGDGAVPFHLGRPLLAKCRAHPSPRLVVAVVLHLGGAEFPLRRRHCRLVHTVPICKIRAQ
jgi:hypothetical protein